ncbi:MAG: biopolymer transporter ExbD [Paracoccaceae bacterium]|nr:biopolymer transporter ExbD [Paracoccaceae bacterium]
MSRFSLRPPPRRPRLDDAVPMINVAFLLLIFFLLAARIVPPAPIEVALPEAVAGDPASPGAVLFVGPDGSLGYGAAQGEAALAAIVKDSGGETLTLRVDRAFDAARLAALLARLDAAGVGPVSLSVIPVP